MNNVETGKFGENIAAEYLKSDGFKIEERNFKCRIGEIDIIASKGNVVSFVEVKTRTGEEYGRPCEAVSDYKQKKIKKAAAAYMMHKKMVNCDVSFDVIEVYCNHMANCF